MDARRDGGGVWPPQPRRGSGFSKLVVSGLEGMEGGPLQGSAVSLESPLPPHAQGRGVGGGVWDWDTFPRLRSSPFALRTHCGLLSRAAGQDGSRADSGAGDSPAPRREGRARTCGGCECKRRRAFILGGGRTPSVSKIRVFPIP